MKDEDQPLEIPILSFASPVECFPLEAVGREVESFPVIRVRDTKIAAGCYGIMMDDNSMAPTLRQGMVAVFFQKGSHESAKEDIFFIGRKGELPLVRKVVKNEIPAEAKTGSKSDRGRLRKSFMTPTPLHIPESRISPIADSTHQMIYFKSLAEPEELSLLPADKLLWMHPMVSIIK